MSAKENDDKCDHLDDDRTNDRTSGHESAIVIGARLRAARERLELTQGQLSKASTVKLPTLKDHERGKSIPGGDALMGYARAGINVNWLLGVYPDAPMLIEPGKRAEHADFVGDILGVDGAAERAASRRAEGFARYKAAQDLVDGLVAELGFDPGQGVRDAIKICVFSHHLSRDGVVYLLDAIKRTFGSQT